MEKKAKLKPIQILAKIKAGQNFMVSSEPERKTALGIAKNRETLITTRERDGGYLIIFA